MKRTGVMDRIEIKPYDYGRQTERRRQARRRARRRAFFLAAAELAAGVCMTMAVMAMVIPEKREFESTGTGFSFTNYNAHEMLGSVRYAEYVYSSKRREWNKIIDRAMAKDYSWWTSAAKYQELYDWLIGY